MMAFKIGAEKLSEDVVEDPPTFDAHNVSGVVERGLQALQVYPKITTREFNVILVIVERMGAKRHWSERDVYTTAAWLNERRKAQGPVGPFAGQKRRYENYSSPSSSKHFYTYQDRGKKAKDSPLDSTIPQPVSLEVAEEIWPKKQWDDKISEGKSPEKTMQAMLPHLNYRECAFEVVIDKSYEVGGLRPDMLLKLKAPEYTPLQDSEYLEALEGVEGVPKIYKQIGSMLAIQPVGEPFSRSKLAEVGMEMPLADLVDILKSAHKKNIVNIDIRIENIMIANALYTTKKTTRLFILDWGFAAKLGEPTDFGGSLITASNEVLLQVTNEDLVTVTAVDDLVSLVRCLCLFFNFNSALDLYSVSKNPAAIRAYWDAEMQKWPEWKKIHEKAVKKDYRSLKIFLSSMQGRGF